MRPPRKVVTIGGGTGHFALLSGLKEYPIDITAVVTMADSGGSTGQLRDELGVLPPGDVRQCLVALSEADETMRAVFTHRFSKGTLRGHTLGNLVLSGLEQVTGSIGEAINRAEDILNIKGHVLPVSTEKMNLCMTLKNGKKLTGEHAVDDYQHISRFGVAQIALEPHVKLNPLVRKVIREADLVVVGPGDLYTSLLPNMLVEGMPAALLASKAKKVFISPLMNRYGHTDGCTVCGYIDIFTQVLGVQIFDAVLYNSTLPSKKLVHTYLDEGEPVLFCADDCPADLTLHAADMLASAPVQRVKGDRVPRSFIRHDSDSLAHEVLSLF